MKTDQKLDSFNQKLMTAVTGTSSVSISTTASHMTGAPAPSFPLL